MAHFRYELARRDDKSWVVTEGVLAKHMITAPSEFEARLAVNRSIATMISTLITSGAPIPLEYSNHDGPVIAVSILTELRISLHNALLERGMTRADLMRALGVTRTTVDRLFDMNHKSQVDQLEAAFRAIGYRRTSGRCLFVAA